MEIPPSLPPSQSYFGDNPHPPSIVIDFYNAVDSFRNDISYIKNQSDFDIQIKFLKEFFTETNKTQLISACQDNGLDPTMVTQDYQNTENLVNHLTLSTMYQFIDEADTLHQDIFNHFGLP